jgi:hypothetical protein
MMCVKYLMSIHEKVSMSLWTLIVGILRFNIFLVVALCMVPLIPAIMVLELKLSILVTIRVISELFTTQFNAYSQLNNVMVGLVMFVIHQFFSSFLVMAAQGSLSLQYVNSRLSTFKF